MTTALIRIQQVEILAKLHSEDPEWWNEQLGRIMGGETLEELAILAGVKFGAYWKWIMQDPKREKQYEKALAERKVTLLRRVEDRLFTTALSPSGHPTHADANRAAEILISRNGTLTPGNGGPAINLNVTFVAAENGKPARVINGEARVDSIS